MSIDRIVDAAREATRRAGRGLVAGAVVAVLTGVAFGFLTAALYMAFAGQVGAVAACLAVAGLYLVAALLVVLVARKAGGARSEPRRPPERPGLPPDAIGHLVATFLAGVRAGREGFGRDRDRR